MSCSTVRHTETPLPGPANSSPSLSSSPSIAGSVLPIRRAEELLATLPGVLSAKIVASDTGAVDEIHVLTTAEFTPKQTVRNIESALIAHLGMRVDHRKISVAATSEPRVAREAAVSVPAVVDPELLQAVADDLSRRRLYFEDVEVRRSRARGVTCRVTLRKGDASFIGEAEGLESERARVDLAARAAIKAIAQAERGERTLALDGAKLIDAFDREFVFVGVSARVGRDSALLTGSCEVRESAETASVLAALDATNRWIAYGR
jgi:hypothetical protein